MRFCGSKTKRLKRSISRAPRHASVDKANGARAGGSRRAERARRARRANAFFSDPWIRRQPWLELEQCAGVAGRTADEEILTIAKERLKLGRSTKNEDTTAQASNGSFKSKCNGCVSDGSHANGVAEAEGAGGVRRLLQMARREIRTCISAKRCGEPGGSVRGERANLKGLVLGCIEAKFCK